MCRVRRGELSLLDIDIEPAGNTCSTVYDNKYFLSSGNRMIVVEKFVDSVTIYDGLAVRAFERIFNPFTDRLAILTDDNHFVFQIEREGSGVTREECVWESEDFALTYASGNQYIRQVLVKTANDVDVVVQSNRSEQRIRVKGSPDTQKININFKGELFRVKIIANGAPANISSLNVVVGF
jgi:hypothetical protein